MLIKIAIFLIAFISIAHGHENKARYDNYRMYRLILKTDEQLNVFKEIESRSDSYIFLGHAREINRRLTIIVSPHKIAEITDIINFYKIDVDIAVRYF